MASEIVFLNWNLQKLIFCQKSDHPPTGALDWVKKIFLKGLVKIGKT